ncbi:hypothetical protein BJY00DRAFT_285917 [Aspergillus carlsbadensis]|nr:hypothetical protein BJY00DRAFT_285917 [Aspergillus carlsbadensis]
MPSPTPSSPASHTTTTTTTGFQPKQCNWDGCSSSTWFRTEAGLARHVRTIHIAPDAYPCVEPGCSMKFGRNDHLNAHRRNVHGF